MRPSFLYVCNFCVRSMMIEVTHAHMEYAPASTSDESGLAGSLSPLVALGDVSLRVRPGEVVSVVGANGSGKSTLVNLMCGALVGEPGMVVVDGVDPADGDLARRLVRRSVGHVFQNPADQIVSTLVLDEVVFGPRNLGWDEQRIAQAASHALEAVGLSGYEAREVEELSGGEQQRLAIAAVLAMEPGYLVLDEVTSQLDSAARPQFRALFRKLARRRSCGVVQVTHDPLEVLMGDRVVVVRAGGLVWEGEPRALLVEHPTLWGETLPPSHYVDGLKAAFTAGYDPSRGVEPEDLISWVNSTSEGRGARQAIIDAMRWGAKAASNVSCEEHEGARGPGIIVDGAFFAYEDPHAGLIHPETALSDVSVEVPRGSVTLVAGATGSGKSTLAALVAGLEQPLAGTVAVGGTAPRAGDVALSFQHPERQLFLESVARELAFAPRNQGEPEEVVARRVEDARVRVGISPELMTRDPFSLSGGQGRRVAIGGVLTLDARALVLDEPTSGLDTRGRSDLHALVRSLARDGMPVMVVSHDLEEWLDIADRVLFLRDGRVAWSGSVADLKTDAAAFSRAGLSAPEAWSVGWALDGACPAGGVPRAGHGATERPARRGRPERGRAVRDLDARVKIVVLLALTAAVFAVPQSVALALWAVSIAVALRLAGVGVRRTIHALRPLSILFAIIVVCNLISLDGTAEVMLAAPFGLSLSGACRALMAMARILLLVAAALVVSETSTPTQLADAVVRLMRPLKRVGVPVGSFGLTLSLALRFIPLAMEEVTRVASAQRARGVKLDEGGAIRRVRRWGAVLVPAVVSLFRRADRVAESMDARCSSEETAAEAPRRPLGSRDVRTLCLSCGIMVAIAIVSWMVSG